MRLSTPWPSAAATPHDPASGAPAPPVAVERAHLLWAAGAAVGAVSGLASAVVALVLSPTITARVVAHGGDPRVLGPAAVRGVLVVGLVQVAVAAVGYLVAPRLREGQGWVRIVLLFAGLLGVGLVLAAATASTHPALVLLDAVGVLLVLLAVLHAYQPRTSAWFRSVRAARNRAAAARAARPARGRRPAGEQWVG